jgi:putative ABC transport system ATP-binding protein
MMITHNMNDAIAHGNRLIMMDNGKIIYDVQGEEKNRLTKADLMAKFAEISGTEAQSDKMLLS